LIPGAAPGRRDSLWRIAQRQMVDFAMALLEYSIRNRLRDKVR